MAVQGQVVLRGRFAPGVVVALVRPVDQETAMRAGGDARTIARARVDESGAVAFTKEVEVGTVYFVQGYSDGTFIDQRVIGSEEDQSVVQHPIGLSATRLGVGGMSAGFVPPVPHATHDEARHVAAVDPAPVVEDASAEEPVVARPRRRSRSSSTVKTPVKSTAARKKTSSASAGKKKAAVRSSNSSKEK